MKTGMKKYKVYVLKLKDGTIIYVGQTRQSLTTRCRAHKLDKKHHGKEFTIELVTDFDDPEPMFLLESMLIEQYDLVNNGWNKSPGFTRAKKEFDAAGSNNGFYGHTHTEEVKRIVGDRSIGNSYAKGNRSRRGMKNSKEHNKAISENRSKRVMCIDTGDVFKSGRAAAKKMKLQPSKISLVCNGIRRSTGGYKFCFVD